jgi:hypothetical protein
MKYVLNKKIGMGKNKNKTWKWVLENQPFMVKWYAKNIDKEAGEIARYLLDHFPVGCESKEQL